jgi:hypothetical protein
MLYKHKKSVLFDKVAWCVTEDSHSYRCNLHLIDWLRNVYYYSTKKKSPDCFFPNADKLFPIQENHFIVKDEECKIAKEILKEYQRDLVQKYFSGKLCADRFAKKITRAEYFLLTLREFLQEHECETTFYGNKMYNTKDYKSYGSWGGPLFVATYVLTDYAVVYHKIYLTAQMYCLTLRKNPLDTETTSYISAEETKKVIDTREMKVSRY